MGDGGRYRSGQLAIGTVLARAFGVMAGNPVTVFGIAFLFGALPQALIGLIGTFDTRGDPNAEMGVLALGFGYVVVYMLCNALSQGALVRATSAYLDQRPVSFGECVRVGLLKALPVIGLTILFVLGIMLGFLLLVVPGIMLFVRWSMVTPALVEEDIGITEAFGRSNRLTKGARWSIFFLMIVVLVISWLLLAVAAIPAIMFGAGDTGGTGTTILSLITGTITGALWSTTITSLYFSLREAREGPRTDALADVFA